MFRPDEDIVRRYNEVPLRQMAEREAGGPVVTHLDLTAEMTDEAKFMTGQVLSPDGGLVMNQ